MEEEIVLLREKNSGHRRLDPQASAESNAKSNFTYKCEQCNFELKSQGLFDAQIKTHMKDKI